MKRWLFNLGAGVSLALVLISAGLWPLSLWRMGGISYSTNRQHCAYIAGCGVDHGRLSFGYSRFNLLPGHRLHEGWSMDWMRTGHLTPEPPWLPWFLPAGVYVRELRGTPSWSFHDLIMQFWAIVVFGVPGPLLWLRNQRRMRKEQAGLCPTCGYDLRGSPAGGECPECGAPDPAAMPIPTGANT